METLSFDRSTVTGPFKILNGTNGGPWHKRYASDQYRDNLEDYKALRIPYSLRTIPAFPARCTRGRTATI